MAVLHNGLQLSRNIGETLFRAIDNDLASAGLTVQQTNSEGETNEVSIETFASNFLQSFANRLFSAENVAELSLTFKKAKLDLSNRCQYRLDCRFHWQCHPGINNHCPGDILERLETLY